MQVPTWQATQAGVFGVGTPLWLVKKNQSKTVAPFWAPGPKFLKQDLSSGFPLKPSKGTVKKGHDYVSAS